MKTLDIVSKLSIVVIVFLLAIGVNKLLSLDKKATNFYTYKNIKINLQQVKSVKIRVEYIITDKEDDTKNIFKKYTTSLNENEINNIDTLLKEAQKSEYYNIEIATYMLFDTQKIELFHSPRYLKLPTHYSVNKNFLRELQSYGIDDFQYKNLLTLKDKIYTDRGKFYEDVINLAKLKDSPWARKHIINLGVDTSSVLFMQNIEAEDTENLMSVAALKATIVKLAASYKVYEAIE
jgi:hypothetical protein